MSAPHLIINEGPPRPTIRPPLVALIYVVRCRVVSLLSFFSNSPPVLHSTNIEQVASAMEHSTTGEPSPVDREGLCLLSLDGGGVRGLSTLFILRSIMARLNCERMEAGLPPVKPCEIFDLIGGTGTGG